jgi:adenosylhomocysteine nucleosidase
MMGNNFRRGKKGDIMIGIIGAMPVEIGLLVDMMGQCEEETISHIQFYKGSLCGTNAVVAVSGVGKVHAAICAQTMILKYAPEVIINTGVAGSLSTGLTAGDIVVATSLVQYDIDNTVVGDPAGCIPGIGIIHIPCDENLVRRFCALAEEENDYSCQAGTIATGDQFITDEKKAKWIHHTFGALACEQEGGSIAQVCYTNKVAFCVIRAISDSADSDSHIDYFQFKQLAAKRSAGLIQKYIGRYGGPQTENQKSLENVFMLRRGETKT